MATKKKRIMRSFKMEELSGVDRPAQVPATVVLLKRDETIAEERTPAKTKADEPSGDDNMKTEKTTEGPDLAADLAKLAKRNEELTEIMKMSAEHRAHFDTLEGEAREDFLTAPVSKRDEAIAPVEPVEDPVVFKSADGTEFRKSDDPRLVQMAKARDADRAELAKERSERLNAVLAKRADEELANLPGESLVKCEVLRALDSIVDEDLRKGAFELLKAGNDAMATNFQRTGTALNKNNEGGSPVAELENLAKRYAADHKVGMIQARVDVLGTPEGERLYAQTI